LLLLYVIIRYITRTSLLKDSMTLTDVSGAYRDWNYRLHKLLGAYCCVFEDACLVVKINVSQIWKNAYNWPVFHIYSKI